MPRRLTSADFIGRAAELADLDAALAAAAAGKPGVVLLGGEAGVGKTRLVGEVVERAGGLGARVLTGACMPLNGATIPLLPIAEALRSVAGDLIDLVPGGIGDVVPARLYEGVLDVLAGLASERPLLVVIEDAHWADHSTLELLTYLSRALDGVPMLLVVTFRHDEVAPALRGFIADAARRTGALRLELCRFGRDETAQLIAAIRGAPAPVALLDAVHDRAEGNAFFTEEVLAATEAGESGVPANVRDALTLHLQNLDGAAKAVVDAAAAGGRRVHHRLLSAVAGADDVDEALAAAIEAQVLVAETDGERFAFRHALLQELAYEQVLPARRVRLHAAYADALATAPELTGGAGASAAAEISIHRLRAGDDAGALEAAVRAGDEAAALAPAEARANYERALALWEKVADPESLARCDHAEVLARAARAVEAAGDPGAMLELVERALGEVDDPLRRAVLLAEKAVALDRLDRLGECDEAFGQAIEVAPPEPTRERAWILARRAMWMVAVGRIAEGRMVCEEALMTARAVGARAEELHALVPLGNTLVYAGEVENGIQTLREAYRLGRELALPLTAAGALADLVFVLTYAGRAEEAASVATEGATWLKEVGCERSQETGFVLINAAEARLHQGNWDAALELAERVVLLNPFADPGAVAWWTIAGVRLVLGDQEAAAAALDHTRDLRGTPFYVAFFAAMRAELALLRDDLDTARVMVAQAVPAAHDTEYLEPLAYLAAVGARVEADAAHRARARRRPVEAAAAADAAAELCERVRARAAAGGTSSYAACLLATAEAEATRATHPSDPDHWAEAAQLWDRHGSPHHAQYARYRQAEALLARSASRRKVEDLLRGAHAAAATLQARPLVADIEALARRARVALDADAEGGPTRSPARSG